MIQPDIKSYDDWHWRNIAGEDVNTSWHNFVRNKITESDLVGKKVLEIGCGRGGFSHYLISKYPDIVSLHACDFSDAALKIASENGKSEKIAWQKEDIQNLTFRDAVFDTVISCETIEHVGSPSKAIRELARVLKPGGKLFLTCPNYFNLFGLWCVYRKLIGKPYTEGGQPYVRYILLPVVQLQLALARFKRNHFHSAELVFPWFVPKTVYSRRLPRMISFLGSRTFYVLTKK